MFVPRAGRGLVALGVAASVGGYLATALLKLVPWSNNPAVLATVGILAGWRLVGAGLLVGRLRRGETPGPRPPDGVRNRQPLPSRGETPSWKPLALAAAVLLALAAVPAVEARVRAPPPQSKASVMQQVGCGLITIAYNSPAVKGRAIWGGGPRRRGLAHRCRRGDHHHLLHRRDGGRQGGARRHLRPLHPPGREGVDGDPQQGRQAVGRLRVQGGGGPAPLSGDAAGRAVRRAD